MQKSSVFGDARFLKRTALWLLVAFAVVALYTFFRGRPVDVPTDIMNAVRLHVGEARVNSTELTASRRDGDYIVQLIEVTADGRRFVYSYEVNSNLQVTDMGMTVGVERSGPLLLLAALLAGAAFFSFAALFVLRPWTR